MMYVFRHSRIISVALGTAFLRTSPFTLKNQIMKKHYTSLLLIIAILLSKTTITKAQVNFQDSLALVDLYNATNGPDWNYSNNWLTLTPVSQWYGITTRVIGNGLRVTETDMYNNNLKGSILSSFGNLNKLQRL
jgi:hypothetical protein